MVFTSGGNAITNSDAISYSNTTGNTWTAQYTVHSNDSNHKVSYTITVSDPTGNTTTETMDSNANSVIVDLTAPTIDTSTTNLLMIVAPESNELFTAVGDFEIVETFAANSNDYVDVVNPEAISLGSAYPNPFNPTTSFELNVGNAGHVTMNVYNVMGQVVETLVNNTMDAGSYNITWDATNFSSGMYVVKAETVNGLASQKVMLVK